MGSALHVARPSQGNGPWERIERAAGLTRGRRQRALPAPCGWPEPHRRATAHRWHSHLRRLGRRGLASPCRRFPERETQGPVEVDPRHLRCTATEQAVDTISTDDVLSVLKPIWSTKRRLPRGFAVASKRCSMRPRPKGFGRARTRLAGGVISITCCRSKAIWHVGTTRRCRTSNFPGSSQACASETPSAAVALELCILTAARSGELLGMRWSEIDLQNAIWSLPAERMKAGRPHRVPLSPVQ